MNRSHAHRLAALCVMASLVACGGSDDEPAAAPPASGTPPAAATPPPPPPPPPAVSVPVSGVAATGAPLANSPVEIKCASGGTASTTTSSTGGYTATVTGGTLPCVIRVTANGQSIHSVIEAGVTLPAVANVTPLTDLLTSQIAQGTATGFFDNFNAAAQARLTPAAVTQATTQVTTALAGIVSLQGDDLLRGTLVPSTGGEGGNLADQKLDALARAMREAGTSISAVAQALVTAPGTPPPVLAAVPLAAASCPAFRSGDYWGIEPIDPQNTASAPPVRFNARTMQATYDIDQPSPTLVTYLPVAGQPCRFTAGDSGGVEDLVVSSSGVSVLRFPEGGRIKAAILAPKQDIALSELAGDWNIVGASILSAAVVPFNGRFTIAADGAVTGRAFVSGLGTPIASPNRTLALNTDGSFRQIENGVQLSDRMMATRAPNGVLTLFFTNFVGGPAGVAVARRQESVGVRPVGSVADFWNFDYTASGVSAIADLRRTITSINTSVTPNTETRIAAENNRVDTRSFNFPRLGMIYRAANTCTTGVGGPPLNCSDSLVLAGQGTGFSPSVRGPASGGAFEISISKP